MTGKVRRKTADGELRRILSMNYFQMSPWELEEGRQVTAEILTKSRLAVMLD